MSNTHQTQQSLPLQHESTDGRTFINASLWMVDQDGHRVIFCRHEPIYRIALGDEVHLRMVAVNLRLSKSATTGRAGSLRKAPKRGWRDIQWAVRRQPPVPDRSVDAVVTSD